MSDTKTRAMRKKVKVTQGKHQGEPTCDNCGLMTIRQTGSGNHRHCDQMNLYIPDWEQFPSCSLHTWTNKTSREHARLGVHWETTIVKEGGEA
jgi:hypothetical protein